MVFSSITFIFFFFPLVFIIYYALSPSRNLQNSCLFLAGIIFYAWGEPVYVLLLLASILFNWIIGLLMEKNYNPGLLVFGLVSNLAPLFLYKYIGPLGEAYGLKLILPIGMSIYTFRAISYLVDLYRQDLEAEKNLIYFGLYMSFFPKVLLGPLMQYEAFREQTIHRKSTLRKCAVGACRFITGLAKKILIAGNLAVLSDLIFNYSAMGREIYQVPALMAWMGLIACILQIYYDMSGYSDMAIGLGLMFGYVLDENFDYPLSALSVREFWRRFNITIMNWFHRYVYQPLGGNKYGNKDTMVKSLFITWIVIGMWHGLKSNYILWGIWNCLFVLVEYFIGYTKGNRYKGLMHVYTLIVITLGFVLIRAQDMYQAGQYYMNMFAVNYNGIWNGLTVFLLKEYAIFIIMGCFFASPIAKIINQRLVKDKIGFPGKVWTYAYPLAMLGVLLLSLSYLVNNQLDGFWYLRY